MQAKAYEFLNGSIKYDLILTDSKNSADKVDHVAKFLGYDSFVLPDFRANMGDDLRPFKEELFELLDVLLGYYKSSSSKKLLISPVRSIIYNLPKPSLFQTKSINFGDTLDLNILKSMLYNWGYSFVDIVEEEGEVSFRGDIVDIFSRGAKHPIRVSLFDDEVESIRVFDAISQKSNKEELENFEISPAYFSLTQDEYEEVIENIDRVESDSFLKDIGSLGLWALSDKHLLDLTSEFKTIKYTPLDQELEEIFGFVDDKKRYRYLKELEVIDKPKEYQDIEVSDIASFMEFHKSKNIKLLVASKPLYMQYDLLDLNQKIIYKPYIVNVMSKDELIISLNKEQKKRRKKRATIILDELKVGDYVVHEEYGVGIFKGLVNTKVLGSVRDFVQIAYQNDDKVLLPVENIDLIDRYISDGGALAVVDRLGKGSFTKLKAKVKAKLFEIAKDIIEIAAKRELTNAPIIRSDFEEISIFQSEAGFSYTEDQQKSIEDIFCDLRSGKVMDRLLSGDVGFGKTEVAMNAIFAAIKSGYQTALIAPTTLLVSQHFKTISKRFEPFGISIVKLDRFTTTKQKSEILRALKDGRVDLCIGTHALLGVEFNNLGVLIIDEEHKFGVKQKEKLKSLRSDMHILSMSATPIPRSLNMALSSIKQYSQLLTPPSDREDVRTFVKEYDENLLKEIILREIRRGGQIFYVHNRIASIEQKRKALNNLLPDLKILTLHSKIPPATTEKEMMKFEEGEYELLLSTSIVESGIHIPNVNTMIVDEANNFGMADLHQLRGRVGRGSRQGYCYFLVKDRDELSEDATKRLVALESNSFLGAGAVLAYHDLEIRGGGNLVGEAQSGHIKGIGYSLYLKMLEDALNTLLNGETKDDSNNNVEIKLAVSAYLSSESIGDDRVRLELYRRLSKCHSPKDVYEIEEEMVDRFGKLDSYTKQFLEVVIIKILARKRSISLISSYNNNITITFSDEKKEYLKARSKDDDDILSSILEYLRN